MCYHFHTEGAVVDGLALNVDVHQRTCFAAAVTRAKSGRHERLVTHGCRGSPKHLRKIQHTQVKVNSVKQITSGRLFWLLFNQNFISVAVGRLCVCVRVCVVQQISSW